MLFLSFSEADNGGGAFWADYDCDAIVIIVIGIIIGGRGGGGVSLAEDC